MFGEVVFTYKGYEYRVFRDVMEDNIKLYHECTKNGKNIMMPGAFYQTSPYREVTLKEFKEYVDTLEVWIQA